MRRRHVSVALVAALGCHHPAASPPPPGTARQADRHAAAPTSSTGPAPRPAAACLAPADPALDGQDSDVDGDSVADRVVTGYRDVTIYVRRGDCLRQLAHFEVDGHVAFVSVVDSGKPGMRDLSIDTWLYHGDRLRTPWFWDGHTYVSIGGGEDIPGPRLPHH